MRVYILKLSSDEKEPLVSVWVRKWLPRHRMSLKIWLSQLPSVSGISKIQKMGLWLVNEDSLFLKCPIAPGS